MDMQEAAEQSDAMLDAVLEGIDPDVQWAHGPTTTRACGVTRRRTVMTVVSPERRQTFLDRAENFWRKNGYRIKAVNKDEKFPAVYAVTRSGFGVSVSFRGKGQAFLEADSPCVKESKVAAPTTEPNGPAYEDVYPLPRPNVQSDFWSGEGDETASALVRVSRRRPRVLRVRRWCAADDSYTPSKTPLKRVPMGDG